MTIEQNNIYNMDCLEGMKAIPDGSVDAIICDLPYEVLHKNNDKVQFVHNVFFHTYEEFRLATRGGLFESEIPDCKEFLENYFNIKL